MWKGETVSVILPTYNEKHSIRACIQEFQAIGVRARVGDARGPELTVRGARLRGLEIKIVVTGLIGGKAWNHLFKGHNRG